MSAPDHPGPEEQEDEATPGTSSTRKEPETEGRTFTDLSSRGPSLANPQVQPFHPPMPITNEQLMDMFEWFMDRQQVTPTSIQTAPEDELKGRKLHPGTGRLESFLARNAREKKEAREVRENPQYNPFHSTGGRIRPGVTMASTGFQRNPRRETMFDAGGLPAEPEAFSGESGRVPENAGGLPAPPGFGDPYTQANDSPNPTVGFTINPRTGNWEPVGELIHQVPPAILQDLVGRLNFNASSLRQSSNGTAGKREAGGPSNTPFQRRPGNQPVVSGGSRRGNKMVQEPRDLRDAGSPNQSQFELDYDYEEPSRFRIPTKKSSGIEHVRTRHGQTIIMSEGLREKIMLEDLKNLRKNAPHLKTLKSEDIYSFCLAYDLYAKRLIASGLSPLVTECIDVEVFSRFSQMYGIDEIDQPAIIEKLRVIAKSYQEAQKEKVTDHFTHFRFELHDDDLSHAVDVLIHDIEDQVRRVGFTKEEEKALTKKYLGQLPNYFFKNGYEYQHTARKLFTFADVINYLRQLPDSQVDIDKLRRAFSQQYKDRINRRFGDRNQNENRRFGDKNQNENRRFGDKNQNWNRNGGRANNDPNDRRQLLDKPYNANNNQAFDQRRAYDRRPSAPRQDNQSPNRNPDRTLPKYNGGPFKGQLRAREAEFHPGDGEKTSVISEKAEITSYYSECEEVVNNDLQYYEENDTEVEEEDHAEVQNVMFCSKADFIQKKEEKGNHFHGYVYNKEKQKWRKVNMKLDSGCTHTCAPIHMLRDIVTDLRTANLVLARTAGGDEYEILGKVRLDIKLKLNQKPVVLQNVKVFLVESPKWNQFLIGEDVLRKLKIMPEQQMSKLYHKKIDFMQHPTFSSRTMQISAVNIITKKKAEKQTHQNPKETNSTKSKPTKKFGPYTPDNIGSLSGNTKEPSYEPWKVELNLHDPQCTCSDCVAMRNVKDSAFPGYAEPKHDDLGYMDSEQVLLLQKSQLDAAVANQLLTQQQANQYLSLLQTYNMVFGTKKSVASMSDLPPMEVHLKPDAQPFVMETRQMHHKKRAALEEKISDLLRIGMVEEQGNPLWGSPVFMVPKKNLTYRMVVDLRKLNDMCHQTALLLPDIEGQMQSIPSDVKFFACFDCLSGFDLLRTHPDHVKYFGITTPMGNFALKGAPMGYKNTPVVYQNRIIRYILGWNKKFPEDNPNGLPGLFCRDRAGSLLWLDDILIYATTFEEFMEVLEILFKNLLRYKVRLNMSKCEIIKTQATWCGRVISPKGWQFARSYYEKILQIARPKNLKELEQVIYVLGWLQPSIPSCAKMKDHFMKMSIALRENRKLTDRVVRKSDERITVNHYWTVVDDEVWSQLRNLLHKTADYWLRRYDHTKPVIIYTDASDFYWSLVMTQEHNKLLRPILFLSGKFTGPSLNWTINEKECFPLIYCLKRYDYLVENSNGGIIFRTDHKNLIYLTNPRKAKVTSTAMSRLNRWAIAILETGVSIEHIPGTENVFADMLSRWAYPDIARALHLDVFNASIKRVPKDYFLTVAPGWTQPEEEMLRRLIQKYGIGKWNAILETHYLPGKTIAQMITRLIKMLGIQSFREFKGLKIDPLVLRPAIAARPGFRRGGVLIAAAPSDPTKLRTLQKQHRQTYSRELNHFVDLAPLRRSQLSPEFFQKASPEMKAAYLHTLIDYRAQLQERCRMRTMLKDMGNEEKECRMWLWLQLREILGEMKRTKLRKLYFRAQVSRGHYRPYEKRFIKFGGMSRTELDSLILSCARPTVQVNAVAKRKTARQLTEEEWKQFVQGRISFLSPNYTREWEPISEQDIEQEQIKYFLTTPLVPPYIKRNLLVYKQDKLFIPPSLLDRLIIHNHVQRGHSSIDDEVHALKAKFALESGTFVEKVKRFRNKCLHCQRKPAIIRRPLYSRWHAKEPGKILHLDYLKVYHSYLLVICDDLSRKVELIPTDRATMEVVVDSLLWWRSRYGFVDQMILMTDNGSHFAGRLVRELSENLVFAHRFSVAYSPWTNGSAESVNVIILKTLKSLISQYKVRNQDWTSLVPLIQCHLNHRRSAATGLTPNETFMGVRDTPVLIAPKAECRCSSEQYPIVLKGRLLYPNDPDKVKELAHTIGNELRNVWERTYNVKEKIRMDHLRRMEKRLRPAILQYQPGEFVLVSTKGVAKHRAKTKLTWIGPFMISEIVGHNVYKVVNPGGEEIIVHAARVRWYDGKGFTVVEEVNNQFLFDRGEFHLDKVVDIDFRNGAYFLQCQWLGFEESDGTWEPFQDIYEDAPETVEQFLYKEKDNSDLVKLLYNRLMRDSGGNHNANHKEGPVISLKKKKSKPRQLRQA